MKAKSVFIMKCAWDKKVMFSLLLGRNLMPNLNFVSCTSLQVLWSPSDSISMESDIVHWWKDNGQSQGGEAPPAQPQEEEVELHHLQQMGRSHGREHRWCETFLGAGEQRDGGGEHTGSLLWGTYWWHRLILAPFFENPKPPGGVPGLPYLHLWDYEAVELFFLNNREQYLEVQVITFTVSINIALIVWKRQEVNQKHPQEHP